MLNIPSTEGCVVMSGKAGIRYPVIDKTLIVIVGGFGSGKTEVSVNLAKYFAASGQGPVTLIDLDLVNPYFRTREVASEMAMSGINVIVPPGDQSHADLPILLPEIKGVIRHHLGKLIIDAGGDTQGTRALGSLADEFTANEYEMLMVLNSRRPQTADVAGCLKTMHRIETAAKLKFTGLIANSHMIDETDITVLDEGYQLACEVSRRADLRLVFVSAKAEVLDLMDTSIFECPVLPLTRIMLKPWERRPESYGNKFGSQGE
jgi:hypothetical protein